MKVDYVVIASDDNPMYLDFYPIVAKRWNDIGIKTIMIHITNEDSEIENEYGIYRKVKTIGNINSGLQSQISRLYASVLYPEYNLLMSDIDMLPINTDYYINGAEPIKEEDIYIYTGQPYGHVPYYPMCYILGKGSVLSEALDIKDMSFEKYVYMIYDIYHGVWDSDENFMYDRFNKWNKFKDNIIINNTRDLSHRIDRYQWSYTEDKLKSGYYIDSHLLRPYNKYKDEINKLIKSL